MSAHAIADCLCRACVPLDELDIVANRANMRAHGLRPPQIQADQFRKVLDHIERSEAFAEEIPNYPERWDQGLWVTTLTEEDDGVCGTAACFAGWTALLNGYTVDQHDRFIAPDGVTQIAVDQHAHKLLGLTTREASRLFDSYNTLEDLRTLVAKFLEAA